MMPTISGESYAAPGKALASLGNAIGNLGDAFAGQLNKEDTFRDQLAIHKFDNEESIRQLQSFESFNREDPNGFAIEQHTQRQQRFNNMQASLRTDDGRKKALMYWETTGHNKYERDTSFEYGKRHEVIAKGTESAVASEYAKIDFNADPDAVIESIKAAQQNASAVINSATLPKKDALHEKSKDHFINSLKRAFTDETGHVKPEFYEMAPKLLQELGGAPQPQQGRVGPQSSVSPSSGGTVDFSEGGKLRYNTSVPASIRHNNPGATYPANWMKEYGMNGVDIIGGGHKIANFPDAVSGAAANIDLMHRGYAGMPLSAAIRKWSGGNSPEAYTAAVSKALGISPNTVLTKEIIASDGWKILKAQSQFESGGKQFALSDDQWQSAQGMFREKRGLGGPVSAVASVAKPDKHSGILTSLDDSPTPQEIRSSGASVLDMDLSKPGAKLAIREAKQKGMKVAAYHEGAGGGASWGEGSRDLTQSSELTKLQDEAKALAKSGADYLHVDNLHDMKPGQLAKVAQAVKDAGLTMIGKNNPQGWLEVIQKNPDLKPPYVVIEHGMKDKAAIEAARKLSEAGVPVHFVEFGDPGIDKTTGQPRKDPIATPDEAKAFADANPWAAGVTHMKSQDSYNGRESAGAKTFRAENTIPGAPVRVADASGRTVPGNVDPTQLRIREYLINHQDEFAKAKAVAEMRVVGDASASIDQIIKHAEAGGDVGNKMVDDITDKLFKINPALAAKYGLEEKLTAALEFVDEANQYKLLNLQQQETVLSQRRKALAANLDKLPMPVVEAETQALKRFEALHNNAKEGMKKDLLTWAEKVGVQEVPETNWGDPASILQRVNDAKAIAEHFGTDAQFFKEGDKKLLTDRLKAGGPEMLAGLKVLYQGFGPSGNMEKAMAQLGKLAPETAMAGWMMTAGHSQGTIDDLAAGIQRQRMREMGDKKIADIKHTDSRKVFIDTYGQAFSRMPGTEGAIIESANAIYEARAARKGWTDPKPDEYKKILSEVVGQTVDEKGATYGGIQTVGGMFDKSVTDSGIGHSNSIVLPMNVKNTWSIGSPFGSSGGNSYKQLVDAIRIDDLVRQDRASSGPATGDGKPLGVDSVRRATPVTVGPGQYWLATGDPNSEDPKFIKQGTTGNNYVLDLGALEPALKTRRPDLYKGYQSKSDVWTPGVPAPAPQKFQGDFQHGSDVLEKVDQVAPQNYQPGPTESTNVIDERPSTTYTQGRNGQARQPNQIPMPTADQTPDQLKGLLPN